jgi:hypothetical protein
MQSGPDALKLLGPFENVMNPVVKDPFVRNWLNLLCFLLSGMPVSLASGFKSGNPPWELATQIICSSDSAHVNEVASLKLSVQCPQSLGPGTESLMWRVSSYSRGLPLSPVCSVNCGGCAKICVSYQQQTASNYLWLVGVENKNMLHIGSAWSISTTGRPGTYRYTFIFLRRGTDNFIVL